MNALMAGVSTNNDALRYAATRRPPTSPHSDDDGGDDEETAGGTSRLRDLIALLNARDKLYRGQGLQLFKLAYIQNMKYKVERYTELARRAEEEVEKHKEVLDIKVPGLKVAAGVTDDSDNWHIFESVSEQYLAAKDRAAAFVAMADRARARLWGSMGKETVQTKDEIRSIRDRLVLSLEKLSNYSAQEHIVEKTVELVESFIKDPRLFRTKLMNFMLLGGAGTGKSTIAEAIGEVFSHAGIFVGDRLITAGRAELVGQYEGQTVTKTRDFLTSNLDAGVIFIDEAYAITPWQNGKPEGYGSEAATAMVEFMTRYAGLYCIIVAGYEREMTRYFLPCNDGLSRRFPNKYVLNAMSADDLVHVFARALLTAQGRYVPHGRATQLESYDYFDDESWQYLRKIVDECLQGTVDRRRAGGERLPPARRRLGHDAQQPHQFRR